MAINDADDYVLPCERRLDDLWGRIESGHDELDAHEQACPHCKAAHESLLVLREATHQLADEPVPAPAGLTGRIMSAVRAEIRRSHMLPLSSAGGSVDVSEQAVAVVLRFAADSVPGVRARRCAVRVSVVADDVESSIDEGVVDVELSLALRYGTGPAERTLAAVRERVAAAAMAGIGLRVARCDLVLEDLYS